MYLFSVCDDFGSVPVAAGTTKAKTFAWAKKWLGKSLVPRSASNGFVLKWRPCEDGEYAIEDPETGEIYGWISTITKIRS